MIKGCRPLKIVTLLLLLIFLFATFTGCSQTEKAPAQSQSGSNEKPNSSMPSQLTIGASEPGSSWFPMAAAMKEVIEKEYPNTRVDIFYGGGDVNLKALEEKKIDFGITFSVSAADAMAGRGRFEKPLTNISSGMGLYIAAMELVTRPNSPINSIGDLKGKKASTGMQGYATTGIMEQILPLYNLSKNDVKWEYATAPDIGILFKDNALDFFAVHTTTRVPFPMIQDVSMQTPIKLIGIEEEILDKLIAMNPGHQKVKIPANLYKGQTTDILTQGTVGMLATRKDLSEEVVYNVISTIIKNADYMSKAVADLEYISKEKSAQGLGIPIHPGAEKYFK